MRTGQSVAALSPPVCGCGCVWCVCGCVVCVYVWCVGVCVCVWCVCVGGINDYYSTSFIILNKSSFILCLNSITFVIVSQLHMYKNKVLKKQLALYAGPYAVLTMEVQCLHSNSC